MFGRSQAVLLDSYSRRRARKRFPRWLLLLLTGGVLGAAAVIGVQERWLPPRLSADASTRLRTAFDSADRERTQLQAQLADARQQLQQATTRAQAADDAASASQRNLAALRSDITTLVDALPPDPRGGAVQVRAARFKVEGGQLAYDIVLTRERSGDKPFHAVLQLVLSGSNGNASARLDPVSITMGRHASARGSQPLPPRIDARQVTVQVLDRPQGQLLGMRVMSLP